MQGLNLSVNRYILSMSAWSEACLYECDSVAETPIILSARLTVCSREGHNRSDGKGDQEGHNAQYRKKPQVQV
eukprot:SAG31_NODE_4219_length_3450_cov_3.587586_5_plen_73_part_00